MLDDTSHTDISTSKQSVDDNQKTCSQTSDVQLKTFQILLRQDEDGRFVVTCPHLPGVVTDGVSKEKAIKNARYAISDMLDFPGKPEKEFNISVC